MNRFFEFLSRLFHRYPSSFDSDYLAASSDVYDLEYRMRELERRNRQALLLLYR